MSSNPILLTFAVVVVTLAGTGCSRRDSGDAASTAASSAAMSTSTGAASSTATSLPVAPAGLSNESAASQSSDLSNSAGAHGRSNLPEPPSRDNPAAVASPMTAASQSVSSTAVGAAPPASSGSGSR